MKRKMKMEVRMFCHHFAATEPSLELGSNLLLFRPTSGSNFHLLHLPLLAPTPPRTTKEISKIKNSTY